jgi:hypothetical protein
LNPSSSTHLIHKNLIKIKKKKKPILPNSNGGSKPHKNPERKNTNFHLKSPNQNHNKKINCQMGFQMRTQNSQHQPKQRTNPEKKSQRKQKVYNYRI